MLDEKEIIEIIRDHLESQFPRRCNCCGKNYSNFAEFIRTTAFIGEPVSYIDLFEDTTPQKPIGIIPPDIAVIPVKPSVGHRKRRACAHIAHTDFVIGGVRGAANNGLLIVKFSHI